MTSTPTHTPTQLMDLYEQLDRRVEAILSQRPDWPCRLGCDACCRALGQLLEITEAEWNYLREGVAQLPPAVRAACEDAVLTAEPSSAGLYTCPFLNEETGGCRVYQHRPAACRMFGFYVSRIGNRWCNSIQAQDDAGELEGMVLGNQDAVEQQLTRLFGPARAISVWQQR